MMKRGRKPHPAAKRKLKGNPTRRPIPKDEPKIAGTTTPPKWLTAAARTEWRRLAPRLELLGILTPADRAAFAGYCAAYARMVAAETFLKSKAAKGSLVFRTEGGALKPWPHIAVANQAADSMRKFLVEFGLTPSSRTRIAGDAPKKKATAAAFLFGDDDDGDSCADEPN